LARGFFWRDVLEKLYQVFISSTYSDLTEERKKVWEAVVKSGHIPAGMEGFPASSQRQFEYIKRMIDRCDYYVLVIGGRYGSLADGDISYTEKEYDYAVSKGFPVLAFLHREPEKIEAGKSEKNNVNAKKLAKFRTRVEGSGIVDYWQSADELATKVSVALSQEINLSPGTGWIRGDQALDAKIFNELEKLRKENKDLRGNESNEFRFPDWIRDINEEFVIEFEIIRTKKIANGSSIEKDSVLGNIKTSWAEIFQFCYSDLYGYVFSDYFEGQFLLKFLSEKLDGPNKEYFLQFKTKQGFSNALARDALISYDLITSVTDSYNSDHGILGSQRLNVVKFSLTEKGRKYGAYLKMKAS
jgi:Domain of unknown function (DUF4062)